MISVYISVWESYLESVKISHDSLSTSILYVFMYTFICNDAEEVLVFSVVLLIASHFFDRIDISKNISLEIK